MKYSILMGTCFFLASALHAGPELDAIVAGKNELIQQMASLKSSGNELLSSGAKLQNSLLLALQDSQKSIVSSQEQLKVPIAIFMDPLKELQDKAVGDKAATDIITFLRSPGFRDAYFNLWKAVLNPFGIGSLPDVFNNLNSLLNTVQSELAPLPALFTPIVHDLDACVVVNEDNRRTDQMQPVTFDYVMQNRAAVNAACQEKFQHPFDPKGIYQGLEEALKSFDSALQELTAVEEALREFEALLA